MATTDQASLTEAPVDPAYAEHFKLLNRLAATGWEVDRAENMPPSQAYLKAKESGKVLCHLETPAMPPAYRVAITDLIDRAPALWQVIEALKTPIGIYVQEIADLSHRNPLDAELVAKLDYWTSIALRLERITS